MPLSAELLRPVSADQPSGSKLKGSAVLTRISEARRQEDAQLVETLQHGDAAQAKRADWELVREVCEQVLITQSKDLQVAAWLVESLVYLEQIPGLTQGLRFVQALLETFWDSLYPELDDGLPDRRVPPLSWLGDYLNAAYSSSPALAVHVITDNWLSFERSPLGARAARKPSKREFAKARLQELNECENALLELETFCGTKFPADERPSFNALLKALQAAEKLLREKYQPELAADSRPSTEIAKPAQPLSLGSNSDRDRLGSDESSISSAPSSLHTAVANRSDAINSVVAAAQFLRSVDPQDPIPYLLLRAVRWGELRSAENGQLNGLLEAPPPALRKDLKHLAETERWSSVLDLGELAMCSPYGRAWLDLQRYIIKACEALEYTSARKALLSELRSLLADLPDLTKQTLLDDTGTANPQTMAWLQEERLAG